MVGFQYAYVVVTHSEWVFDIHKETVVHSRVLEVVAAGSHKQRNQLLVVKCARFFEPLFAEVVERLA
jgi:hypothetical protein